MKTLLLAAALVVTIVSVANRDVDIYSLENLQVLEDAAHLERTRAALTWVNENALEHLPIAATLRAEDALAGIAMQLVSEPVETAAR